MITLLYIENYLHGPVIVTYFTSALFLIFCLHKSLYLTEKFAFHSFIVISIAVLFFLRFPTFVLNTPLNPDEAEFLANAIKFRTNMNTWLSVDTGSSGPINSFVLMWPFLFGADTGFSIAHITATVILICTWLLFEAALSCAPITIRICSGAALVLFLGGVQCSDFIHYSSELVPMFLLMFALVTVLAAVEGPLKILQYSIAGFFLGLTPFAKLQASFIALALGFILLWQVVNNSRHPFRSGFWLVICACMPAILILTPLTFGGGLEEFLQRYIFWAKNYIDDGWGKTSPSGILPARFIILGQIVNQHMMIGVIVASFTSIALAFFTLPLGNLLADQDTRRTLQKMMPLQRFFIVFLILIASVASVIAPGRAFPHYAFFIIWPLMLLAGIIWSEEHAGWSLNTSNNYGVMIKITSTLVVLITGFFAITEEKRYFGLPSVFFSPNIFKAGKLLPDLSIDRQRALVWGWAPEIYVWSGLTPATRDIINYNVIWSNPNRDYYRRIFISDLRESNPEYIIDYVTTGNFAFNEPGKHGIHSFPELDYFVSSGYELLSPASKDEFCPRVFVRRDLAAMIKNRYVTPSKVYDTLVHQELVPLNFVSPLFDNITFEAFQCSDSWFPADGKIGEIVVELAFPVALEAIEILNTRGGARLDRASRIIRLKGYHNDNIILDRTVSMLQFPYLTNVLIPENVAQIDKIIIQVESYAGIGGGLNEIRLRKR